MNRTRLLSFSMIIIAAVSISSCKPSRVWATKDRDRDERPVRNVPAPPPSRNYYAASTTLIISPTPGFTMNRFSDGRYYHRSPQGLLYWKGYDNRFFLDKSYFNRVSYSKWEYKEWKKFSKQR